METITIDVGVYTPLRLDLTNYDFTGIEKLVFTIKNLLTDEEPVVTREFTESKEYNITISPEESRKLLSTAQYDFDEIMEDGKTYKASENGEIRLRFGVGDCDE